MPSGYDEDSHGIDGPATDDFPIQISIYSGFSIAMFNNQMVSIDIYIYIYSNNRQLYQKMKMTMRYSVGIYF